jgi:hypothetical protein
MIPGIIAGPVIDRGSAVIIRPWIAIGITVGITTVIAGADANPHAETHSGIGLAGEAQHSQQRNHQQEFFHNNLTT